MDGWKTLYFPFLYVVPFYMVPRASSSTRVYACLALRGPKPTCRHTNLATLCCFLRQSGTLLLTKTTVDLFKELPILFALNGATMAKIFPDLPVPYFGTFGSQLPIYQVTINPWFQIYRVSWKIRDLCKNGWRKKHTHLVTTCDLGVSTLDLGVSTLDRLHHETFSLRGCPQEV